MKMSVIMPVCNQASEVPPTVLSVRESLDNVEHETILVDDGSIDGSCHGVPSNVLVLRMRKRRGCAHAKRAGFDASTGDIIVFSDAHCRFPKGSLQRLAMLAQESGGVVQPVTLPLPKKHYVYGARFALGHRGVVAERVYSKDIHNGHTKALYGSVYVMTRAAYEKVGGWPKLPGVWGGAEVSLSLACWHNDVPILLAEDVIVTHFGRPLYTDMSKSKFSYSVDRGDTAGNYHYIHSAYFPSTYETFWKPILHNAWGARERFERGNRSKSARQIRKLVRRTDKEHLFFSNVLKIDYPVGDKT